MFNLYMYFSKVVASFGDCLDQEFFEMHCFADKVFNCCKRCIYRSVT